MRKLGALTGCTPVALLGCARLELIEYTKGPTRAAWQQPAGVIESPGIGPGGRVYDVEVDDELTARLRSEATARGDGNVVVVRGRFADPLLPDGAVDLLPLCNTHHHIEDRVAHFSGPRAELAAGGRVAVIDMKDDLRGILRLFATKDHSTPLTLLEEEMGRVGYRHLASFEYLPTRNFVVFSPKG